MLKTRIKRRTAIVERAASQLGEIQASIKTLADEDLLDLADIFVSKPQTHLWEIASAEMLKRNLSL